MAEQSEAVSPAPHSTQPALSGLFYWRVIAWWLMAVITTLSLIPEADGGGLPFDVGDKAAHLLSYTALMLAFGLIRRGRRILRPILLLVAMGVLLEFVQLLSMYGRMFEWQDMLANALGVLLGAALLQTPLRHCYYAFENALGVSSATGGARG